MVARIGFAAAGLMVLVAAGQPQLTTEEGSRALWDSQFLRQRPQARTKAVTKPEEPASILLKPLQEALVGLTIWRVRPSAARDEPGARVLVHSEKGAQEWTPERLAADLPLAEGERVRFSIESARSGYLYVIDREEYANGSFGEPYMLFPTTKIRGGRNRVQGGTVVEMPSWDDTPPYVWLKRSRPDHVAEVLTILVTPEPLEGLHIGSEPLKLNAEQVKAWESKWGAEVKRLSARQQQGKSYTTAEKYAASGYQSLTQADPTPETLYVVPAKEGEALIVNVPLRIRK
jgi:hypothetical protein